MHFLPEILKSDRFCGISPTGRKSTVFDIFARFSEIFPDHRNSEDLHRPATLCSRWNQNAGHGAKVEASMWCSNGKG